MRYSAVNRRRRAGSTTSGLGGATSPEVGRDGWISVVISCSLVRPHIP